MGWSLAGISGVFEVAYFVFLSRAYQLGELSLVYPLARGLAPLLLVVSGLVLPGEHLNAFTLIGVACLLAGILAVRPPFHAGSATVPAVLTGLTIATYSTVDKVGVGQAPPWLYGWVVWVVSAILLTALAKLNMTRQAQRTGSSSIEAGEETRWPTAVMIGVMMISTYTLILFALRLAPLALVAPVRESAIVLVTVWGVWRLHEHGLARLRLGGALSIVAGIAIIALAG
jgi:drug/metabolite transporter (DMT)-like permease